jgi:hypothetical protein
MAASLVQLALSAATARRIGTLPASGSDWIEAYGLGAHRSAFEAEGLVWQDLRHVDTGELETAPLTRMKKFDARRFARAIEDARRGDAASSDCPGRSEGSAATASTCRLHETEPPRRLHETAPLPLSQPLAASAPHSAHVTRLKRDLLLSSNGSAARYDKTVPPNALEPGEVGAQARAARIESAQDMAVAASRARPYGPTHARVVGRASTRRCSSGSTCTMCTRST